LAYIIFGDRLRGFKRDVNQATDGFFASCRRPHGRHRPHFSTGPLSSRLAFLRSRMKRSNSS
ncbi:hypothetical protein ACC764_38125, partial [Rhizobium ruizarguesonis]